MFFLRNFANRFVSIRRLPKFYTCKIPYSYSTAARLNANDLKNKSLTEKVGQKSSLVGEVSRLKKIFKVDQAMLQRMDNFVSQPGNLAGLNPKEYCILLGYYSFCMHRNFMMADRLVRNPAFLQRFNSH